MACGGSTEPYFNFEPVNFDAEKFGHFRIETLALNRRALDTLANMLCRAGFSIQRMG
jgi:hypothetical protein